MCRRIALWIGAGARGVALLIACLIVMGCEAGPRTEGRWSADTEPLNEAQIVAVLLAANASDLQAGKLAASRGESQVVKAFAERMLADHGLLQERLSALNKRRMTNPSLPPAAQRLVRAHANAMEGLQQASGRAFDLNYLSHEIDVHQHLVSVIGHTQAGTHQREVAGLLSDVRSVLQHHLEAAQAARAELVGR
jgi:putative membrane protein